jgi:hypothetical protein
MTNGTGTHDEGRGESGRTDEWIVAVMDDAHGVVDEVYGPFRTQPAARNYAEARAAGRHWALRRLRAPESAEPDLCERCNVGEHSTCQPPCGCTSSRHNWTPQNAEPWDESGDPGCSYCGGHHSDLAACDLPREKAESAERARCVPEVVGEAAEVAALLAKYATPQSAERPHVLEGEVDPATGAVVRRCQWCQQVTEETGPCPGEAPEKGESADDQSRP